MPPCFNAPKLYHLLPPRGRREGDERWTESSRDEWMDESENSGFETTLLQYSMCMAMIGFMLPPPIFHRRKNLFHHGAPSEEVTHQFSKHLYTNIIRDIDVSS